MLLFSEAMIDFGTKSLNKIFAREVIVDVGGGTPFQKELLPDIKNLKNQFFISVDQSAISQPTIRGDIHLLPIKSRVVDGVICKAVLEHVENPFLVIAEIKRILKKNGIVYIWVPFLYPYHPSKEYQDYFRFTSDGVKVLMHGFKNVQIVPSLGYFQTVAQLLPNPISSLANIFAKILDRFIIVRNQNSGWHILAFN